VLVGQGTGDISETLSSQLETIQDFHTGRCNVVVATSVAEEGLDFPECNAVIRMDGADSNIALTQSRGRVRGDGEFVVIVRRDGAQDSLFRRSVCRGENVDAGLLNLSLSRDPPLAQDGGSHRQPAGSMAGGSSSASR
jgi:endoribonuclease Dicer